MRASSPSISLPPPMSHPPSPLPPPMAPLADRRSSPFNQFGDTTLTKVFVGGLAWETQRDTMRRYFEQFGEILEAVVITDKATGRSKGYGFVTFRDPEGARRACEDPTPVIDGRRANCNLASLGIRSRPSTPQHGGRFRAGSPYAGGSPGGLQVYGGTATYSQTLPYAYQQGFPYPSYGYPPYLPEYPYLPNMYNPYATPQYSSLYGAPGTLGSPTGLYPYHSFTQAPPETPGISVPQQAAGFGQLQAPQLVQYANPGVSTATITSLPPFGGSAAPLPVQSTGLTSDHHMSPSGSLAGAGPSPVPQFAMPGSTQQQFSAGGCSQQSSG